MLSMWCSAPPPPPSPWPCLPRPPSSPSPKPGVTFAAKVGDMSLLGVGLRTKALLRFKVYALGLYVADSGWRPPSSLGCQCGPAIPIPAGLVPISAEITATVFHFDQTCGPGWPHDEYVPKHGRLIEVRPMKASTRIRAEGKLREVEGALEEVVGAAAKNRD